MLVTVSHEYAMRRHQEGAEITAFALSLDVDLSATVRQRARVHTTSEDFLVLKLR